MNAARTDTTAPPFVLLLGMVLSVVAVVALLMDEIAVAPFAVVVVASLLAVLADVRRITAGAWALTAIAVAALVVGLLG